MKIKKRGWTDEFERDFKLLYFYISLKQSSYYSIFRIDNVLCFLYIICTSFIKLNLYIFPFIIFMPTQFIIYKALLHKLSVAITRTKLFSQKWLINYLSIQIFITHRIRIANFWREVFITVTAYKKFWN